MPTWWWTNDILIREIRKVVLVIIFEKTLQKGGGTCIREEHMGKENRSKDAETVVNFAGIPLPSPAASIFFDEWSVLTSLTISYVRTRHTCYRLNFYLYLDYFNFWTFPAFFSFWISKHGFTRNFLCAYVCSISYYNTLALYNTRMLKRYCEWAPEILPALGMFAKKVECVSWFYNSCEITLSFELHNFESKIENEWLFYFKNYQFSGQNSWTSVTQCAERFLPTRSSSSQFTTSSAHLRLFSQFCKRFQSLLQF